MGIAKIFRESRQAQELQKKETFTTNLPYIFLEKQNVTYNSLRKIYRFEFPRS